MAQTYTKEQALRAVQDSGIINQFSDADLKMADINPDALMTILKAKQDYAAATTPEARALANQRAELARSSYGNYTGGRTGAGFYVDPLSPQSFTYEKAPTYTPDGLYSDGMKNSYEEMLNYGPYSYDGKAPEWESRHDATKQDILGKIVNHPEFSYDPATDQLYGAYRKQYAREGQRAQAEALAQAAAASGGQASSYAATAAAQAGNYYGAQLTDKIPTLYQLAYNKYLDDYSRKLTSLDAVQGQEKSDYAKHQDRLAQYNTDRAFDYTAWLDRYDMLAKNVQIGDELDNRDFERYKTQLAQYNTDRNFYYQQLLDEIDSQARERAEKLDKAQLAASYNDYSLLQNAGINTAMREALERAELGDYSALKALGVDISGLTGETETASGSGGSGGGGGSRSGGSGNSHGYTKDQIMQLQRAAGITADGIWGPQTQKAYDAGYRPDGTSATSAGAGAGDDDAGIEHPEKIQGKTIEEYSAAAANYSDIAALAEGMTARGDGKAEIQKMLNDAYLEGALTITDRIKLQKKYAGGR